jgi:hypothetical protein
LALSLRDPAATTPLTTTRRVVCNSTRTPGELVNGTTSVCS